MRLAFGQGLLTTGENIAPGIAPHRMKYRGPQKTSASAYGGAEVLKRLKSKGACGYQRSRTHRLCAGVPKRSRTSGLLLRRQSLYPTELLGHNIIILSYFSEKCNT